MGKSRTPPPPASDGGAMTFMMFTLRGDSATMQQGFRTMAETIERVAPGSRIHTAHVPAPPALLPAADEEESQVDEALDGNGAILDGATTATVPNQKKPTKPPKSPVMLPDLNFTDVEPTLPKVFEQHPIKKIATRYLVIAYWLKKYKKIEEVSMDHMYSGFRACGYNNCPNDADSPLRYLAKQGYLIKSGPALYRLHHVGENKARELLGEP